MTPDLFPLVVIDKTLSRLQEGTLKRIARDPNARPEAIVETLAWVKEAKAALLKSPEIIEWLLKGYHLGISVDTAVGGLLHRLAEAIRDVKENSRA